MAFDPTKFGATPATPATGFNPNQFNATAVSTPSVMPQAQPQRGMLAEMLKRPVERLVMEPARRVGEGLVGAGWGFMNEAQKDVYTQETQKDKSIHVPLFGDFTTRGQKALGQGGAKQIVGENLETASYLYSGGKAGPWASTLFKPGSVGTKIVTGGVPLAKAGFGGGAMYGAGEAFQQDRMDEIIPLALTYGAVGTVAALTLGATLPPLFGVTKAGLKFLSKGGRAEQAAVRNQFAINRMNNVGRINPTEQIKFKEMSASATKPTGESVGEYLTTRGIYGGRDEITQKLAERWVFSRNLVDDTLAKMPGEYRGREVEAALQALLEREQRIMTPGIPSQYGARINELATKYTKQGLNMAEINELKRLYERNVKLDYKISNNVDGITKSTDIDNALREWQFEKARFFDFKEMPDLNRETRLAYYLTEKIGNQQLKQGGNNALGLTDWIVLSGGDAKAIAELIAKRFFGSKAVQSSIAQRLAYPAQDMLPQMQINLRQAADPQTLLPSPTQAGQVPPSYLNTPIPMGPPTPPPSGGSLIPAKKTFGQDPNSGRFFRAFTTEGQTTPTATQQPQTQSSQTLPQSIPKSYPLGKGAVPQTAPKLPPQHYAGAAMGFEKDEEGNITFSPEKALVGMILGTGSMKASQALTKTEINRLLMGLEKTILNTKRAIPFKDVAGKKASIPAGEALTAYRLKNGNYVVKNGAEYVVNKGVFENLKAQSLTNEAKPFTPELEGTEMVVKGDGKVSYADLYKYSQENGVGMNRATEVLGKQNIPQTKYKQYTLPGGEKYREILIQAPKKPNVKSAQEVLGGKPKRLVDKEQIENETGVYMPDYEYATAVYTYPKGPYLFEINDGKAFYVDAFNHTQEFGTLKEAEDALMRWTADEVGLDTGSYISPHWEEPNVIAHLRMTMRKYKDKTVAFMEEMQSDWAKEARAKGFAGKDKPTQIAEAQKTLEQKGLKLEQDMSGEAMLVDRDGNLVGYDEMDAVTKSAVDTIVGRAETFNEINLNGVPYHPLVDGGKWKAPTVKRALQEAVAEDAEYFAWITGDQTSARYNLATHVDEVMWSTYEKGGKSIDLVGKDGRPMNLGLVVDGEGTIIESANNWKGKKLDEVLGKGLADKIMEKPVGLLSGQNLKFGGEWANNLYDKEVKSIIEDVLGVKVEMLDMGLPLEKKQVVGGSTRDNWVRGVGNMSLAPMDVRLGQNIRKNGGFGDEYVIVNILDEGKTKFKAIKIEALEQFAKTKGVKRENSFTPEWETAVKDDALRAEILQRNDLITVDMGDDFKPSPKQVQQGIKLTPEIKAIIRGESPITKQPSDEIPETILKSAMPKKTVPEGFDITPEKVIDLVKQINEGGMTYHMIHKNHPVKGYAVSPFINRSLKLENKLATRDDYIAFVEKNADLLDDDRFFVGGYKDGNDAYLDVAMVTDDMDVALEVGKNTDQLSIADIEKANAGADGAFPSTGGSGKPNPNITDAEILKIIDDAMNRVKKAMPGKKK